MVKYVFTALLCVFIIKSGFSQTNDEKKDEEKEDFYNMSLQDLVNLEISVAAKTTEKIADAPGVITAYTSDDIERYGYYTLKDLSNITSGYSSFSSFGETNLETRGQKAGSWNVSKHLLLIDGIPVNHSRANSAPLEYQIPLFFANKVEFLKGPGSALYGNSAFYGVMNLTSKKLEDQKSLIETKFSYGDAGQSKRVMGNALNKNELGQASFSFGFYQKGFSGDSLGANNGTFHFNNDNSTFLKSSYSFTERKLKGFSLGFIYMNRTSHGGEFWGATPSPVNEVTWEEIIPYLKYERELNEKIKVKSYLKYNGSKEKSTYGASWSSVQIGSSPLIGYDYLAANIEALGEVNYEINENTNLIAGVNFDTRKELASPYSYDWNIALTDTATGSPFGFYYKSHEGPIRVNIASAYLQIRNRIDILEGMTLTTGARLDNGFSEAGVYSPISPRIGVVQKLNKTLNIKALYGQALRAPGVKEIGLNTETIDEIKRNGGTGNINDIPNVGAEIIKSFEGGVNYNNEGLSLSMAYFYNTTTDALDGVQYSYIAQNGDTIQPNYFRNASAVINAQGIELEAQYAFNQNLRLMLNHAYAKAVQNDSVKFVDVPTQKTNAAISYALNGKFKIASTLVFRHVWGYVVPNDPINLSDPSEGIRYTGAGLDMNANDELKGYTMLDFNLQFPMNENFGFELQARNLLDTKWKQPSLLGVNSMIPLERRNFLFTVYCKF